jgi:OmpA-OmpF porin, OOP family
MKTLLAGLLTFMGWTAISTYWYVCQIVHLCRETDAPGLTAKIGSPAAQDYRYFILDGSDTVARFAEPPYAVRDKGSVQIPPAAAGLYDSIAGYLGRNPDKLVRIRSLSDPAEQPPGSDDDLGVLRGEFIRMGLRQKGVDMGSIEMESGKASLEFSGELSGKALEISILDRTSDPGVFAVHFESNQSGISESPELDRYIQRLSAYLETHPAAGVIVVGFTDNTGNAVYNQALGLRRANAVRDFLVAAGLSADRIRVDSEGQNNPAANNDTENGKAENRRTLISLQ